MSAISPEEVEYAVGGAYHKAAVIEGLLRSPKQGPRKNAIVRGLVNSLVVDVGTLATAILEGEGT